MWGGYQRTEHINGRKLKQDCEIDNMIESRDMPYRSTIFRIIRLWIFNLKKVCNSNFKKLSKCDRTTKNFALVTFLYERRPYQEKRHPVHFKSLCAFVLSWCWGTLSAKVSMGGGNLCHSSCLTKRLNTHHCWRCYRGNDLWLDCRSAIRSRKINLPANQKGCVFSETTVGKLLTRKKQIFRVQFSVIVFWPLIF